MDSNDFLDVFLKEREGDIARIARATRGKQSKWDLISEAFLLVADLAEKRGKIDLREAHEQDYVLGSLYNRFVKYLDKSHYLTISLDQVREGDAGDDLPALVERLAGPEGCEPLSLLMMFDEAVVDPFAIVAARYSEAAVYIILLERFSWSAMALAEYLMISFLTLKRRFTLAGEVMQLQPSLFDGLEHINRDFLPMLRPRSQRTFNNAGDWSISCFLL